MMTLLTAGSAARTIFPAEHSQGGLLQPERFFDCTALSGSNFIYSLMKASLYLAGAIGLLAACAPRTDIVVAPNSQSNGALVKVKAATDQKPFGSFGVDMRSERDAMRFENTTGQPATFTFLADGQWNWSTANLAVGPAGSVERPRDEYLLLSSGSFAFIAKRGERSPNYW